MKGWQKVTRPTLMTLLLAHAVSCLDAGIFILGFYHFNYFLTITVQCAQGPQKAKFSRLPHALLGKESELLLLQTDGRKNRLTASAGNKVMRVGSELPSATLSSKRSSKKLAIQLQSYANCKASNDVHDLEDG